MRLQELVLELLICFFADDCLLFSRAKKEDCMELVRMLEVYKQASGHEVNVSKSGIMFSKNTASADRQRAMEILRISRSMEQDNYLGLPLMFERCKATELRYIKEKVGQRIQNWGGSLLSQAGKVVMIQSIGHAIPLYAMNCVKLPRGFLRELNMLMAGFWWGDVGSKKREFIERNWRTYAAQNWMVVWDLRTLNFSIWHC